MGFRWLDKQPPSVKLWTGGAAFEESVFNKRQTVLLHPLRGSRLPQRFTPERLTHRTNCVCVPWRSLFHTSISDFISFCTWECCTRQGCRDAPLEGSADDGIHSIHELCNLKSKVCLLIVFGCSAQAAFDLGGSILEFRPGHHLSPPTFWRVALLILRLTE